MNSVAHVLNIDDLAILRPKPIPEADRVRAIQGAFGHVGGTASASTTTRGTAFVCSELAFQTYVDVRRSVGGMLTLSTVAPDDVAIFAGSEASRPFELVTFIHDRQVHDRATGLVEEEGDVELLGRKYWSVR